MSIKVGDIVGRHSYQCDLLFRVTALSDDQGTAELAGEDMRLIADAPVQDLVVMDGDEQQERRKKIKEKEKTSYRLFRQDYQLLRHKMEYAATGGYDKNHSYFRLPGKVLHVDGDPYYLSKCLELYKKLNVPVYGIHMKEEEMPEKVLPLLEEVAPDILVITGHDAYIRSKGSKQDLQAYRNSKHFVRTVRDARKKYPHLDQLMIFAGACQSHFESLIRAGSNFASSPGRVNIHALDPVYIVSKISFTSFVDRINVWEVLRNTITGEDGIGGVETTGFLRTGMPIKSEEETGSTIKV
ncbi:sporulation peptidase YabG [Alkalihalobacillus sp. AL-G]|uniref:sporulation peptidase YabG n=1 Tax=Alkalihalobacillus sp. AL-G TaxID=2926399 RepID=UPI002729722F|nr:sporulation peptidase YabG [Alkalihalobacillus sp. AL-G]WLD93455.1 sporulation peptidase YabG [Alkalihalobacillus sp. AL-G]